MTIQLSYLRDSLTNDDLEKLLDGTYDPDKYVTITTGPTNAAKEDALIKGRKSRVNGPKRQVVKARVYDIYVPQYKSWVGRPDNHKSHNCTASVIFGAYLKQYYEAFGEEDPEWAGIQNGKTKIVLHYITQMISDLRVQPEDLVEYVEELMPMWVKAMRSPDCDFPTARPTHKTFFNNRKTWAQRHSYYNRWCEL